MKAASLDLNSNAKGNYDKEIAASLILFEYLSHLLLPDTQVKKEDYFFKVKVLSGTHG